MILEIQQVDDMISAEGACSLEGVPKSIQAIGVYYSECWRGS